MDLEGSPFEVQEHEADLCVVGGGMAGLTAAVSAARQGARVVLMQDRPVLGGNASSEIRVHIQGADRNNSIPNVRETGILEELRLENARRNPQWSWGVWDTLLYELVRFEPNITLLLNCSCLDAQMEGDAIATVTGWQLTTERFHRVHAPLFADCSGDGVLAPLTGAAYRVGREARDEYGESIAPEEADARTMGMTCLFQARRYDTPQPFTPPSWAYTFETDDEIPYGGRDHGRWHEMGYWWIELGGEADSIGDTEAMRDELLRIVYGVWDHIKNRGDHGAENWALDWIQFLPGKRESRRYIGDHVLTQNDIASEGRFADLVAYGGWTMDDHHPSGFWAAMRGVPSTIFHPAPSPYGIPYRSLYARDVRNLFFAGRCASATHAAMSSTRLMGTACSMGQAVGTAAAMCAERGLTPRALGQTHIHELQQSLLRQDCYLPWVRQEFSSLTNEARLEASSGDPEPLRDGIARPVGDDTHAWAGHVGDWVAYTWPEPRHVEQLTVICDSALDENLIMSYHHDTSKNLRHVPPSMLREAEVEVLEDGGWQPVARISDNHQRLVRIAIDRSTRGVRLTPSATWGAERVRLFAFYVES
ncbi:MAG: FAD-dependent oxidoreductase [Anaerolineae bacterium]